MNGFQRFLLKIVWVFYPTKIYGLENVPEGGAVLACNHYSFIDPVNLARTFSKENASFVAKKELFDKKLFGKMLASFGAIPIDRDKADFTSLITILKVLKSDRKLIIFPEGTRNKTKTTKLQPLKDGVSIFAIKSKKPIVPIMMKSKPRLFRRTKIYFGKPFDFSSYYDKKLTDDVMKELNQIIYDNMVNVIPSFENGNKKWNFI